MLGVSLDYEDPFLMNQLLHVDASGKWMDTLVWAAVIGRASVEHSKHVGDPKVCQSFGMPLSLLPLDTSVSTTTCHWYNI